MDELIDELNGWGEGVPIGLSLLIGRLTDCFLAREAEHATPVTPEWLDGAEARRLGFERLLTADEWRLRAGAWHVDVACGPEGCIEVFDLDGSDAMPVKSSPTIAQVRAAVYLATGRR